MALLFSSGDLSFYLDSQFSKLNHKISLLDLEQVTVIVESKDYAQFVEEYEIEMLRLEALPSRERIRPYGKTGTGFSMAIPFSGDQNLFVLRPTLYDFVPPSAIIEGGEIVLQFDGTESNIDYVYQAFKDTYEQIQNYLTWTERDLVSYHEKLKEVARKAIEDRYDELRRNMESPDRLTRAYDENINQSRRELSEGLEL